MLNKELGPFYKKGGHILIDIGILMKLRRLIKMCLNDFLNETYSRVRLGKHLSDRFPVKNG
jgi:hypothetical protein